MKIAISSDGENLNSLIDQRFGRCPYFLVADINEKNIIGFKVVRNEGAEQGHGAGIKAAEQIGTLDVKAVITGQLGPNATTVLSELGIKTYSASGIINKALDDFMANRLNEINSIAKAHSGSKTTISSNERIFFPLLNDNGLDSEISQHFGHAPFFGLYDMKTKKLTITKNDLNHTDPNKSPIDQIEEATSPTTIFAKGIGGRAINLIREKGLSLKTGDYNTIKEVIDNFDKLEDQTQDCGHEN